jgi:hypothetical protein
MIPVADQTLEPSVVITTTTVLSGNVGDEVRQNNLQLASNTTVNALIVSGVTPMRV